MNEFDPTKREHLNLSPLERFKADSIQIENYENLILSIMRYLSEEFDIDGGFVDRLFIEREDILPSALLFENNPDIAREQASLVLLKVALPLAENFIEEEKAFYEWAFTTGQVALNLENSVHNLKDCLQKSPDTWAPHSCLLSGECPIKFTAYKLIEDAVKIDSESPDYLLPWAKQKIARTIAKVEVAQDLQLIEHHFGNSLVHSYLRRVHMPSAKNQLSQDN